jgi:tRNA U34 5-methylaminomethyl-2-thiouridine-forming methyltransferase MnmC
MFRKKTKNILIIFLLSLVFYWLSSQALAEEEPVFNISLNFQKLIKNFWQKILPSTGENFYKEKYYELLQELAKLKLTLKQVKETEIISQKEKYLPNLISTNILKK